MDPNIISSSYLSPFNKTFKLSKPANYFTKVISLHYINSLLHLSKLLAQHRQINPNTITISDINLATQLIQDPIQKAEYKINNKLFFSQSGGSGKKKIIIKRKQQKKTIQKVLEVENNKNYQIFKKNIQNQNINIYKPYSKIFSAFKIENNTKINKDAKIKIAQLSNELISQLLTLSYQKTTLIPNNHTIHKNDILFTLLEL